MDFIRPGAASTVAFLGVVVSVMLMLVGATVAAARLDGRPTRAWGIGAIAVVGGWAAVTATLMSTGAVGAVPPASVIGYFVSNQILAISLAFSPVGGLLARTLPLSFLVGFHAFRLPLEMILHQWYEGGTLPVQMTWSGHNFDVLTGVLAVALSLGLALRKLPAWTAGVFSFIGLALLFTVASIAVTSTPGPLRLYLNDPPVLLAFHFPYGWIVPFAVSAALFMHIVLVRRLFSGVPPR